MELSKNYDPFETEREIYAFWERGGYFTADPDAPGRAFSMAMPPPNVTGQLHLGHAFDHALQDVLARFYRMRGYNVLWMPGVDHAGIATQVRVEKELRETEGKTRHDLGREEFLKRVWEWKERYGDRIINQSKRLGSSADWTRTRFTMDGGLSRAVREVFCRLWDDGLVYKGLRITNRCPSCNTALSDAELRYEEEEGSLWHIRYPIKGGDGFLTVATTRPETMLGDTAVAVHPDDERYKHLRGKTVILPIENREIPVIFDEYVEKDFGTGCVKITPCHDPNDFEVGERHNLPKITLNDEQLGVKARERVAEELKRLGLLEKIEPHTHNAPHCDRCGATIEPIASEQWFVKMKTLAEEALETVRSGKTEFVPEHTSKIFTNWMENIRDWCVSRQLWWGHRIPAWRCSDCGEYTVARNDPDKCSRCGSGNIAQEEDVLDTWFSSALWPFSTLGWPDDTPELRRYYPTSVLVTGYEIINLWVARMIFSGCHNLGQTPFKTVLIHGMVRDDKGRKMSKSLDNGIDPIDVIDKYGADALRMNLLVGISPGNDTRFFPERCKSMADFCNKLWNAARFTLMHANDDQTETGRLEDKWILHRLNEISREVTENVSKFELGVAAGKLYDFVWGEFCDWYIELCKTGDGWGTLTRALKSILKLLHPFMPHITEKIWGAFEPERALIIEPWGNFGEENPEAAKACGRIIEAIKAIRSCRAEYGVPPSKRVKILIETPYADDFRSGAAYMARLAGGSEISVSDAPEEGEGFIAIPTPDAKIRISAAELVDIEEHRRKTAKELEKTEKEFYALEIKLNNPGFTEKAPERVVVAERERFEKLRALREKLMGG